MKIKQLNCGLLCAGILMNAGGLFGATLELADGSRVEGDLVKIHDGKVVVATAFAGELSIPQEMVLVLSSDEPVSIRTSAGDVMSGTLGGSEGNLTISSSSGELRTSLGSVASAWKAGGTDPIAAAREAELAGQLRKWSYTASMDVSGSSGNTEESTYGLAVAATLEGPSDRLGMYASYVYSETDGTATDDEQIVGANYTNFFTEKMGWYVSQELERDEFEGIDFRSNSTAGLAYKFIDEELLKLEGNAGIGYRYDDYLAAGSGSEDFVGLDLGLNLAWQFADWGKLVSSVTYQPTFDDFGLYLFKHESGIDVPLGTSDKWVMRFGLKNDYNSAADSGNEKLDSTWFARLILNWD
jgi:putative salt-induced outer membrane protein YdiY